MTNILGWGTFAFVSMAVVVLLSTQGLNVVGIHLLGTG
jgi:hypothetical protein